MPPVIKHRDDKQQDQRLDNEPAHVEREKIAGFEPFVNTVQVNRECDGKYEGDKYCPLYRTGLIPEPEMNDDTGKEKV